MPDKFNVKLGPAGELLDVPENEFIIKELENATALNPRQLLLMAARYRNLPLMVPLADKLTAHAMNELVLSPNVIKALDKIADDEMEWSIWDDIWKAIVSAVTGIPQEVNRDPTRNEPPDNRGPAPTPSCKFYCVFGFMLWEDCPKTGKNLIGICFGGKL